MEELATVVTVIDHQNAGVVLSQQSLCSRCGACDKLQSGNMYMELKNTVQAKAGDKVLITIQLSNLKMSALIYGLPTLSLISGIFLGYFQFASEVWGIVTGVVFLFCSFFAIGYFSKKYAPKITKIVFTKENEFERF